MKRIHRIIVKKKIFGKETGAWGAPMSFSDFYFSFTEKPVLISDIKLCKCVNDKGDILTSEEAMASYLVLEQELLTNPSSKSTSKLSLG